MAAIDIHIMIYKIIFTYILVVPLATFMTFNKIKKLASSAEEIEKALDNSEMLELSCDRGSVRRITDIIIKENVDDYTVYVVRIYRHCIHAN